MEQKQNIVTTISGNLIEKKLCVKIGGEFYEKEIDCFDINGKWYRAGNPRIYKNQITGKWTKITNNTKNGIIDYDEKSNSYVYGSFESEFITYQIETIRGRFIVSSKDVFNKIPKIYEQKNGRYIDLKYVVQSGFNNVYDNKGNCYPYQFERLYNSENLLPIFSSVDNNKYTKNLLKEINISNKSFDIFNKYSFGLEFETFNGVIPEYSCKELGLIPLKDGSIKGHEYTTIPMEGNDGVNLLMNQLELLNKYCSFDKDCSVHIHFGGFDLNEEKILKLYNLCYSIQDEIKNIFPYYIYNTGKYKSSGKDYCKKLPQSFETFDSLYHYFSGMNCLYSGDLFIEHPQNYDRNHKWENHYRYYWCNFINLMFGECAKTVEFRIHNPTFNYSKLINWMFICTAILNYAENCTNENDKITLSDIIYFSYPYEYNTIINYIKKRKDFHKESLDNYQDTYGVLDMITDMDIIYETPFNN